MCCLVSGLWRVFSFSSLTLPGKSPVHLPMGAIHMAYHSAWHTEVAVSRMLINFILHSTKRSKDCSVSALSKEVLSRCSPPGVSAGLRVGGTLKRVLLVWIRRF